MLRRFNFFKYIGKAILYCILSLCAVTFAIVLIPHIITGYTGWGIFLGLQLAVRFIWVGSIVSLISSILNSIAIATLSDHVHRNSIVVQFGTSVTIGLITWGITLPVLQHFEDYAGGYGLGEFLFQLVLISAILTMIVSHYFALPELFAISGKIKKTKSQPE